MNQPNDPKKTAPASPGPPPDRPPTPPALWDGVKIGSLVLAAGFDEDDTPAGWWEAIVVAVERDELVVKWRDAPNDPNARRERKHIALLHPSY